MWFSQDDNGPYREDPLEEQEFFDYIRSILPVWFRTIEDWNDCLVD